MLTKETSLIGIVGAAIAVLTILVVLILFVWPVSKAAAIGGIVFTIVLILVLYRQMIAHMIRTSRLSKTGIPARAYILEVEYTGIKVNRNLEVKLLLQVKNHLGKIYLTHCRALAPRLYPCLYIPGREVNVKVDPEDEMNVITVDITHSSKDPAELSNIFNHQNSTV